MSMFLLGEDFANCVEAGQRRNVRMNNEHLDAGDDEPGDLLPGVVQPPGAALG
jgi:hypothetical protein